MKVKAGIIRVSLIGEIVEVQYTTGVSTAVASSFFISKRDYEALGSPSVGSILEITVERASEK